MATPSLLDITPPFDPSNYTEITGAQLYQLVSGLVPFTDKGMIVFTSDDISGNPEVPDASTNTKWKQYLWIRQSANTTGIYVWCDNKSDNSVGGVDYQKWYPVGISAIPAGSIVGSQIANGTITDINISDVDWSKITNVPAFVPATGTITAAMLADGCVTASKLSAGGLTGYLPRISADGVSMEFFPPNVITQLSNPNASIIGKPVIVNGSGNGFIVGDWSSAGSSIVISQRLFTGIVTTITSPSSNSYAVGAAPVSTKGNIIAGLNQAFNPAASSHIVVEAMLQVGQDTYFNYPVVGAIFEGTTLRAYAMSTVPTQYGISQIHIYYEVQNSSSSARSFDFYFGSSYATANAYLNRSGSGVVYGGITSWSKVTEYIP